MKHIPGLYHLTEVRRRFGLLAGLKSLAYGGGRRILGLHIYHIVAIETTSAVPVENGAIEYRFLSPDEVRRLAEDPDNDLGKSFYRRLTGEFDSCFAAISDGKLLNYWWYAANSIEGEHSCGAPVSFPASYAYYYKAYTHPNYRGRGINQTTILGALGELAKRGVQHVFGLVEINNWSSLRSYDRAGFHRVGRLIAQCYGSSKRTWAPREVRAMGIRFGREALLNPRPA